jgi:hypothetical protein
LVISERFVWAHLPKTGGDATHEMLCAIPGLVRFADPLDANDKHMPFFGRPEEIAGKLRVMNIRRLPAWTLSAEHHRATYGEYPDYVPQPPRTPEQLASSTDPDDLLRWMTGDGRFQVDRWLRDETLADDLVAFLTELGIDGPEVRGIGRVNAGSYDHDGMRFTPEQIRRLYERNPRWAAIERQVYGGL